MTTKEKILRSRERKNEKFKHVSLEMETSTHFPLLIEAVQRTQGGGIILELGSGLFSTPLLHWLCFKDKRWLITLESFRHYYEFAEKFRSEFHEVRFVEDWSKEEFTEHYSIVLIDHTVKLPRTRGDEALRFKDSADLVILHDAGADSNPKYGYEKTYPAFKYRLDWTGCFPHTTVLSNSIDVSQWN